MIKKKLVALACMALMPFTYAKEVMAAQQPKKVIPVNKPLDCRPAKITCKPKRKPRKHNKKKRGW